MSKQRSHLRDWDAFNDDKHFDEKVRGHRALSHSRTGRRELRAMERVRTMRNKGRKTGLVTVRDQLRGE